MKYKILTSLFLLLPNIVLSDNYILTIDNKSYDLSLDKQLEIKIGNRSVIAKLEQKDNLIYTDESFSFQHSKKYSPSKSDLDDGLFQTVTMTPLGTVVMIQEYKTIDPTSLMDLMINEITKEERDYGYKITSKSISTKLSDGTVLDGKIVTSKYKGSNIERAFYAYGIKDSGLFIMTQIDYEFAGNDKEFIDQFMETLNITMK